MEVNDHDYPLRDCQGGLLPVEEQPVFSNARSKPISDHRYAAVVTAFAQVGDKDDSATWEIVA